jgi:hypothetical protein
MFQVNEVGDVHLEASYTYPANYYTMAIAPNKVNPFLIPEVRFIRSGQTTREIPPESIKVDFSDAASSIKVSFDAMGYTINKADYWEIEIMPGATLASQTGTSVVLTSMEQQGMDTYLTTYTVNLPKEAKDIKFNADTGKIRYTLPDDSPGQSPVIWVAVGIGAIFMIVSAYLITRKVLGKAKA